MLVYEVFTSTGSTCVSTVSTFGTTVVCTGWYLGTYVVGSTTVVCTGEILCTWTGDTC